LSNRYISAVPKTLLILSIGIKLPVEREACLAFMGSVSLVTQPNVPSPVVTEAVLEMTLPEINARPFTFHSTRHTYASWALMANRPVIWVSKVLGHADIKTTLETYAHVIPEMAPDLSFSGALETQNGGDLGGVTKTVTN
jgi:hypothetical protein